MSAWDRKLPESIDDIISLLDRRIEVHEAWLAAIKAGNADDAVAAGVGTAESHAAYADQYRAANRILAATDRLHQSQLGGNLMATRQMHPGQDANEIKVHTRLKVFDILVCKGIDPDEAKRKAREIADSFTDDYEE